MLNSTSQITPHGRRATKPLYKTNITLTQPSEDTNTKVYVGLSDGAWKQKFSIKYLQTSYAVPKFVPYGSRIPVVDPNAETSRRKSRGILQDRSSGKDFSE